MERIVLEVDDATGNAYRRFSDETKQNFNRTISAFLKKAINDGGSADYKKMLDDMGKEAEQNGLTPEILNDLLHSND
jgi:hypothetical protein